MSESGHSDRRAAPQLYLRRREPAVVGGHWKPAGDDLHVHVRWRWAAGAEIGEWGGDDVRLRRFWQPGGGVHDAVAKREPMPDHYLLCDGGPPGQYAHGDRQLWQRKEAIRLFAVWSGTPGRSQWRGGRWWPHDGHGLSQEQFPPERNRQRRRVGDWAESGPQMYAGVPR